MPSKKAKQPKQSLEAQIKKLPAKARQELLENIDAVQLKDLKAAYVKKYIASLTRTQRDALFKSLGGVRAGDKKVRLGWIAETLLREDSVKLRNFEEYFSKQCTIKKGILRKDIKEFGELEKCLKGTTIEPTVCKPGLVADEVIEARQKVAERVCSIGELANHPSIAVSAGSTVALACEYMANAGIRANCYSNSATLVKAPWLSRNGQFRLYSIGGAYLEQADAFTGESDWFPDIAQFECGILGTSGVAFNNENLCAIYLKHPEEKASIEKMVCKVSMNLVVVADASKIGQRDAHEVVQIDPPRTEGPQKITLITNRENQWKAIVGQDADALYKRRRVRESYHRLRDIAKANPSEFEFIEV